MVKIETLKTQIIIIQIMMPLKNDSNMTCKFEVFRERNAKIFKPVMNL